MCPHTVGFISFTKLEFNNNVYIFGCSQFSEEEKRKVEDKVIGEVDKWMERFDCLVIGPGLGRDPFLLVQDSSHHILLNFEFFLLFDLT